MRELDQIIKALEAQGFMVRLTRRGHYFVTKDGKPITTISGTPSDWRSWRNTLAALRRGGFQKPP